MNAPAGVVSVPVMSERRVSLIGALLVAIGPISMALFTPAMPEIVRAFGTTESAVKLTLSLYFGGFAFAQLVCGPLSDAFGRRPVTVAFMVIYLGASVLALVSPSIEVLIVARFLQGVGSAVGTSVSRALVRDLFAGEQSARIMNLIGIILAIGPAIAPALGGFTMELFGWHAVFVLMVMLGITVVLVVHFAMRETVTRDLGRMRPVALARSYGSLVRAPYFMLASLVIAGTTGALYAQATMLTFVLIDRVGLTPTQFGFGMLAQTLSFLGGSLAVRWIMPHTGAPRLVPPGLGFVFVGAVLLAVLLRVAEPTFLSVMVPIGFGAVGIAFIMPAMTTAALAPYTANAGAASAMMGFLQMGGGLAGGTAAALMGDPVVGLATIIPVMGFGAIACYLVWRSLPQPAPAVSR